MRTANRQCDRALMVGQYLTNTPGNDVPGWHAASRVSAVEERTSETCGRRRTVRNTRCGAAQAASGKTRRDVIAGRRVIETAVRSRRQRQRLPPRSALRIPTFFFLCSLCLDALNLFVLGHYLFSPRAAPVGYTSIGGLSTPRRILLPCHESTIVSLAKSARSWSHMSAGEHASQATGCHP